jgi:flagellar protein FlbD
MPAGSMKRTAMIQLTRLNGTPFAINADLIERVETAPDTVVSMVDGRKYVVAEAAGEVIDRVVAYRASILVTADRLQRSESDHASGHGPGQGRPASNASTAGGPRLRLVPAAGSSEHITVGGDHGTEA